MRNLCLFVYQPSDNMQCYSILKSMGTKGQRYNYFFLMAMEVKYSFKCFSKILVSSIGIPCLDVYSSFYLEICFLDIQLLEDFLRYILDMRSLSDKFFSDL